MDPTTCYDSAICSHLVKGFPKTDLSFDKRVVWFEEKASSRARTIIIVGLGVMSVKIVLERGVFTYPIWVCLFSTARIYSMDNESSRCLVC